MTYKGRLISGWERASSALTQSSTNIALANLATFDLPVEFGDVINTWAKLPPLQQELRLWYTYYIEVDHYLYEWNQNSEYW